MGVARQPMTDVRFRCFRSEAGLSGCQPAAIPAPSTSGHLHPNSDFNGLYQTPYLVTAFAQVR